MHVSGKQLYEYVNNNDSFLKKIKNIARNEKISKICLLEIMKDFENLIQNNIDSNHDSACGVGSEATGCMNISNIILQVRDKHGNYGGHRDLAYGLLLIWYKYFPENSQQILHSFCNKEGCWADIKYFCQFCKDNKNFETDKIIHEALDLMIDQLYEDVKKWDTIYENYLEDRRSIIKDPYTPQKLNLPKKPNALDHISIVAKWIPREKSKYGWLYNDLVKKWAIKNNWPKQCSMDKMCRKFRMTISKLNRTTGVKCSDATSREAISQITKTPSTFVKNALLYPQKTSINKEWRILLEDFIKNINPDKFALPVIELRFDTPQKNLYETIAYGILIAQAGIGRMILCNHYLHYIIATKDLDFMDIITNLKPILRQQIGSGFNSFMDVLQNLPNCQKPNLVYIGFLDEPETYLQQIQPNLKYAYNDVSL